MADVYLVANAPYGSSDVVLRTSDAETVTAVTANGPPIIRYPPKRIQRRDDEEVLLVAALI